MNIRKNEKGQAVPEKTEAIGPEAFGTIDLSDSKWHIGLEGAVRLAAAYPDTPFIYGKSRHERAAFYRRYAG